MHPELRWLLSVRNPAWHEDREVRRSLIAMRKNAHVLNRGRRGVRSPADGLGASVR